MPWTGCGVYVPDRFDAAGGSGAAGAFAAGAAAFFTAGGAAFFAAGFGAGAFAAGFLAGAFLAVLEAAFFFIFMGRTVQQRGGDGQGAGRSPGDKSRGRRPALRQEAKEALGRDGQLADLDAERRQRVGDGVGDGRRARRWCRLRRRP